MSKNELVGKIEKLQEWELLIEGAKAEAGENFLRVLSHWHIGIAHSQQDVALGQGVF